MSLKDFEQNNNLTAVQVAVRIRPLSDKDRSQPRFAHATEDDVLQVHSNSVIVSPPHNKSFTFDHVFGPQTQQAEIFTTLGQKSINKFVQGYNVTMLAYGQTSSGKTYTVGTAHHTGRQDPEQEGIVPRAMALLFDLLHQNDIRPTSPATSISSSSLDNTTKGRLRPVSRISYTSFNNNNNNNNSKYKYSVKVAFVEIYNEELRDLLNDAPSNARPAITIREDTKGQIYWTGVKEMTVNNTDDVLMYLQQGTLNRATGSTDMNEQSSRSHAIFSVTLRQEKWVPSSNNSITTSRTASPTSPRSKPRPLSAMNLRMNDSPTTEDGEWVITTSKLHFVDLAGSERLKRTAAEGDRRKEGININGGLLALGNVISALGDLSKKSTHIPYRDSKLTRLLQDSLGGSAMTLMIACVSPMEYNISETLNTLQYANRARNIKNRMEKNEMEEWLTTDNLDLLRATITKLKAELRSRSPSTTNQTQSRGGSSLGLSSMHRLSTGDADQIYQEQQLLIGDLQRQLEEATTEAVITRERNRIIEHQLEMMINKDGGESSSSGNFEHTVEPIIQEYEKTTAALESQLTLSRAALTHADFRIEELQTLTSELEQRHEQNQGYIEELEGKLFHTVNDAVQDEELLNELKNRIMKFKELDDSTELYILDLEKQLANNEAAYAAKLQQYQLKETQQTEHISQLEKEIADLRIRPNDDGEKPPPLETVYLQERQALHQQIEKLQQEISELRTQLDQQQKTTNNIPLYFDKDHHHQQRKQQSSFADEDTLPIPIPIVDANHEARKRMFSDGSRLPNNKSSLLKSTLASLEHVQSEYAVLKERYKHWTVAGNTTTTMDQQSSQGSSIGPTISTGSTSSSSSLTSASSQSSSSDSIGTGGMTTTTRSLQIATSGINDITLEISDIRRKGEIMIQQYRAQLQRIHGAIQRVEKLEKSTASDDQISTPYADEQREAILDLGQQLRDRQNSLQDACIRFETEMETDLQQLEQQRYTTLPPSPLTQTSETMNNDVNDENQQETDDEDRQQRMDRIIQRVANATQEVEMHRSKTYVLQTKLQKIEVAYHTQQQRKSSASDDQDGIEQLMKKMDALKLQLETREIKSISVKEG
ncbi:P-loop containing nucleoside triphosphate hydrolase protein [Halteromyces radiatus]|uniref:P-loop containing nucleoside triphosphate hydrolase protein n=1 Tax=Halteromyces radiatus TaxID=101107 RepID=UPI00221F8310|nr:P-loop containing nucleoside triphosphate hydrolase protein [Halteromyces radiatus]KAI8096924.1 P-loop containing nucleoside triphosphate hydrolase protein [Halteromyces radiatus]